jgi:hypothetical protein
VADSTFDVTRAIVLTDSATGYWFYSGSAPSVGAGGRYPVIGDDNGKVYLCGELGDLTGTPQAHLSYWTSKVMDFSDQIEGIEDKWKTVDHIRLYYEDVSASTPTTIYLSNDGGVTWTSVSADLGTGAETPKWADFWFMNKANATGQNFIVKVESPAVAKGFIWTAIEAFIVVRGESFAV